MSATPSSSPDRDARIAALEAVVAEMSAELKSRDLLIEKLRVQIARMKRAGFGASSEKLAQLELALEELEAAKAAAVAAKPETASEDRPAPVRALPDHLARVREVIEPAACACPECGGVLRRLGEDVAEQLDVVPVAWRVVAHVRPKYSCRSCEWIVQAPAPTRAIARGRATFATLAHVVVSKFDHHLPLYRQAEMMAAQGIAIDRATLAGWTGQAAALLDPIVARIREQGLAATKLHVDDTPVPVLDPGRGRTATGRLWTYVADDRASASSAPPLVWYRFTPDRSGAHPQAELAAFAGHLQADAYAGFDKLYTSGRVTEVACWAHFRRQFVDLHHTKPTALTTDLLARIAALYAVEGEMRGKPPDARRKARQDRTRPLVDALRASLDDAARRLSPRSEAGKAVASGLKRWVQLTRFLDDGRLEMDNNIAERSLRGVAVGRKNWLFAGSRVGGERAAAILTVIETCKLNGIEPQAYIADVLAKLAQGSVDNSVDDLMPWSWRPEQPQLAQAA